MQDEKVRQTREIERTRGVRPSGHAATTEETTRLVEDCQTQLETGS